MNMDSTFVILPEVMSRTVGEEAVMIDLVTGTYFGLDPVGARAWELIQSGKSPREVCDTMIKEFDVSREVLEHDVQDLIRDLVEKKLLGPKPEGA
jgi:hypothetical protein